MPGQLANQVVAVPLANVVGTQDLSNDLSAAQIVHRYADQLTDHATSRLDVAAQP